MTHSYSLNLAREIEKGKRENAYKGMQVGGKPPLGYDVDKETMMLVVNPFEASTVKMIFSMYIDGASYGQIRIALNERGVTTKWGGQFGNNSLYSILRNPKYTGVYTYSRSAPKDADGRRNGHAYKDDEDIIKVEGIVPPLVSKDDFEKVQKLLVQRKKQAAKHKAKRTYLLSGKAYCGKCGTVYVGNCRPARSDHPEYLTYRCNNRTKRPRCIGTEIRVETLDSIVLGELARIVFNEDMVSSLANGYRKYLMEQNKEGIAIQEVLSRQIVSLQKDMDNLMAVIIKTASDALVVKLNELDEEKKELERQLRKVQDQSDVPGLSEEAISNSFQQAREMLKTGELSTVKALIERYVHKVVLDGENVEIQFNLNVGSRVVVYSASCKDEEERKIPLLSGKEDFGVYPEVSVLVDTTNGERGI